MARVSSTAWSGATKTSMSDAMRSPSDRPPPARTLNPSVPSAARAGHRPMSLISAWAQSSTAPGDADLELAGQVGVVAVAGEEVRDGPSATGRASKTSSASTPDTGQHRTLRAESPQAWTVVSPTSAKRSQIRGHVPDADPVDLDVLAGGDVGVAVAEDGAVVGALAEGVGDHADLAGLVGGEHAAGHLHPHHEGVAALALGVEADPLEPLQLPGHRGDGAGTLLGVAVDDGVGHLEGVALELPALDLVQLADRAVGPDEVHGALVAADLDPERVVPVAGHSDVQAALGLAAARPPPGAGVLARCHRPGGRRAADRQVAPGHEGVDGQAVVGLVVGDVVVGPGGEGVDLDQPAGLVPRHDRRAPPG